MAYLCYPCAQNGLLLNPCPLRGGSLKASYYNPVLHWQLLLLVVAVVFFPSMGRINLNRNTHQSMGKCIVHLISRNFFRDFNRIWGKSASSTTRRVINSNNSTLQQVRETLQEKKSLDASIGIWTRDLQTCVSLLSSHLLDLSLCSFGCQYIGLMQMSPKPLAFSNITLSLYVQ